MDSISRIRPCEFGCDNSFHIPNKTENGVEFVCCVWRIWSSKNQLPFYTCQSLDWFQYQKPMTSQSTTEVSVNLRRVVTSTFPEAAKNSRCTLRHKHRPLDTRWPFLRDWAQETLHRLWLWGWSFLMRSKEPRPRQGLITPTDGRTNHAVGIKRKLYIQVD